MSPRLRFLVIASLVSLAKSQPENPVRPVISSKIVQGQNSGMGEFFLVYLQFYILQ